MSGRRTNTIVIDTDRRCIRCGKKGATQSGYCLACVIKNLQEGKYDHIIESVEEENHRDRKTRPVR